MASAAAPVSPTYYTLTQLNSLNLLLAQMPESDRDPFKIIRGMVNKALIDSTASTSEANASSVMLKYSSPVNVLPTAPLGANSDDRTASTGAGDRHPPIFDSSDIPSKEAGPASPKEPPATALEAINLAPQINYTTLEVDKIVQEAKKVSTWTWLNFPKGVRLFALLSNQYHACVLSNNGIVSLMQFEVHALTHKNLINLFNNFTAENNFIFLLVDLVNEHQLLQAYLKNFNEIFPPDKRQEMISTIIGNSFNRINIGCCEVLIDKFLALGYSVPIGDLYSKFKDFELDVAPESLMTSRQVLASIKIVGDNYGSLFYKFNLTCSGDTEKYYIEVLKKLVSVYFKALGFSGSVNFESGTSWSITYIAIKNWEDLLNSALANKNLPLFSVVLKMSRHWNYKSIFTELLKIYTGEYLEFLKILVNTIKVANFSSYDSSLVLNYCVCFAVESNNLLVLKALAELGMLLTKHKDAVYSPMQLAILKLNGQELMNFLELFRSYRVDFNEYSTPSEGIKQTALHYALSKSDAAAQVVAWLLLYGASRELRTCDDKNQFSTPLELAKGGNQKLARLFSLSDESLATIVNSGENPISEDDDAPLSALEIKLIALQDRENTPEIQHKLAVIGVYDNLMLLTGKVNGSTSTSRLTEAPASSIAGYSDAFKAIKFLKAFIREKNARVARAESTSDAETANMQNAINTCEEAMRASTARIYNNAISGMGAASGVIAASAPSEELPTAMP